MIAVQAVRQLLPRFHNWLAPQRKTVHGVQTAHIHTPASCVTPSFMSGVACLYDLWGDPNTHIIFDDTQHADWTALQADYQAVALDFQHAANAVLGQQDPPIDQDEVNVILMQLPSIAHYDPTPQKAIQKAP